MEEAVKKLRIIDAYAHYDDEADTLHIHIGDREAREAVETEEGIIIDLDKEGDKDVNNTIRISSCVCLE